MFTWQVLICSCSHSVLTLSSCSMFCLYTFSVNTHTHNRNPTVRGKNNTAFFFFLLLGLCCGSCTLGLWFARVLQECASLKLVGHRVFAGFFFATLYKSEEDSLCEVCRSSVNFRVGIMQIGDEEPQCLSTEHP